MHELQVTKALLRQIKREAKKNNIKKPGKAVISLGSLTTYKKEPIQHYFRLLEKEIILTIHEVEGRLFCKDCKTESRIDKPYMILCHKCQSGNVRITKGDELILQEIE